MKHLTQGILALALTLVTGNVWAATSVVEGKIAKVVESKKEIYVKEESTGKKHEYYFTKETKVLHAGQPVDFSHLKADQQVRVTAEKTGKRLDPKQVEILE